MKNTQKNELAVCGFAAVKTLEKINWERITRFYFAPEKASLFGGLCRKMAAAKKPYNQVRDLSELEKLCGSVHHQGVVAMIEMPKVPPLNSEITAQWVAEKQDTIVLDRVGNANNLGAVVRSAAFFGIQNIVIPLDEAQSSITTSSYRVAEGGMEFVKVYSIKSIPRLLMDMKGRMVSIGTSLEAKESLSCIGTVCKDTPSIIVLGNEEHGISREVQDACDHLVIIPYTGINANSEGPRMDSLNVAQASAVVMYELSSARSRGVK